MSTPELFVEWRTGRPMALADAFNSYFFNNGAQGQSVWSQLNPTIINILDCGGDRTGATNNDTALATAFTALTSIVNGIIYFPSGKYKFSGSQAYNMSTSSQGITIQGDGPHSTILYFPNAVNALNIFYQGPFNSFSLRNLCMSTGGNGTSNAVILSQNGTFLGDFQLSKFENLCFRGEDIYGAGGNYWSAGLWFRGISGTIVKDSVFYGTGNSTIGGTSLIYQGINPNYSIQHINYGNFFFQNNTSIQYGEYLQGLAIGQCNFTNGSFGIVCAAGVGGTLSQLNVTDCQFNQQQDQISLGTAISNFNARGNLLFVPANHAGIVMSATSDFCIVANQFIALAPVTTNQQGCQIGGTVANTVGTIEGNLFRNHTTGINLQATSANVNVQSNAYNGNTNNTVNAGVGNTIGGGSA